MIWENIKDHEDTRDTNDPRDFTDKALAEIDKTADPASSFYGAHGKENLVNTLLDLFFAGQLIIVCYFPPHHMMVGKDMLVFCHRSEMVNSEGEYYLGRRKFLIDFSCTANPISHKGFEPPSSHRGGPYGPT